MITKVKHLKLNKFSVGLNHLGSGESCWHRANMFAQGDSAKRQTTRAAKEKTPMKEPPSRPMNLEDIGPRAPPPPSTKVL